MPSDILQIPDNDRKDHTQWLLEVTGIPTATGREHLVIGWIERWCEQRQWASLTRDRAGNLTITNTTARPSERPIYFTAHLDHPAFVIDSIVGPATLGAQFRGGVMEPYFVGTRVLVQSSSGEAIRGRVATYEKPAPPERIFAQVTIDLDEATSDGIQVGDLAIWDLPESTLDDEGIVHTRACDDLAALAAALSALDQLAQEESPQDVRVLMTLGEEVGFIGAIAACRDMTMPEGARLIALENSRAMIDAPIGAGPVVRVGDRLSTFSPTLTASIAKVAQKLENTPEQPVGSKTPPPDSPFKWQRKLMAGGACEASAYCSFGYEATCVCLPLGNYHNMGDLDRVQDEVKRGEKSINATIEPEFIALSDYEDLVLLLVGCGRWLIEAPSIRQTMDRLYTERAFVLRGESDNG
ncbi:MAG: M20/M25/M40 family metallo-hydrolase [Planctomycetota bacterium]|jgi:endoglucanase